MRATTTASLVISMLAYQFFEGKTTGRKAPRICAFRVAGLSFTRCSCSNCKGSDFRSLRFSALQKSAHFDSMEWHTMEVKALFWLVGTL